MIRNARTYVGSLLSFGMAMAIIHIPGLNRILVAAPVRWENYVIALCTGITIVIYEIIRKSLIQFHLIRGSEHEAKVIQGVKQTLSRETYKGESYTTKKKKKI